MKREDPEGEICLFVMEGWWRYGEGIRSAVYMFHAQNSNNKRPTASEVA